MRGEECGGWVVVARIFRRIWTRHWSRSRWDVVDGKSMGGVLPTSAELLPRMRTEMKDEERVAGGLSHLALRHDTIGGWDRLL